MKKSVLLVLLTTSFGATTVAVAQETLAQASQQPRASQPNAVEAIEAAEQFTVHSTVVAINKKDRTVTLQGEDGTKYDVTFGRDLKRFNTVKVGDQFAAQLTRSVIIEPNSPISNAVGTVSYSVQGSTSGNQSIDKSVQQVFAFNTEILRLSTANNTITFVNPDGTARTVAVTNPRLQQRLANLQQGQRIRVRLDSRFQIVNTGPEQ